MDGKLTPTHKMCINMYADVLFRQDRELHDVPRDEMKTVDVHRMLANHKYWIRIVITDTLCD